MTSIISPPEGYDATREVASASVVLRYLLMTRPNTVVTHHDVCERLGREVTPQAVSNAAARMRRGSFGLHIWSQRGLGYVLLTPVPCRGKNRCANCSSRSLMGTCRRLKGLPVDPSEVCWGWSKCA